MEIRLGSQVRDAREAEGTVIIIDVFRAFTTAAIAFDRGVREITLVAEAEDALVLHRRGVGDLLMGEVGGERPTASTSATLPSRSPKRNWMARHWSNPLGPAR